MNPLEVYKAAKAADINLQGLYYEGYISIGDETFEFDVHEEPNWEDNGKYDNALTVLKHKNKYYAFPFSRSGSYFSDWYYLYSEPYEVTPKEETIVVRNWVKV